MKFAANQTFQISGEYEDIKKVLKFAMSASGQLKALEDPSDATNVIIQTTESGLFCVGTDIIGKRAANVVPPAGWTKAPFGYKPGKLAKDIKAFLKTQPPSNNTDECGTDVHESNGFLCLAPSNLSKMILNTIQNPQYCTVIFKPWRVRYN